MKSKIVTIIDGGEVDKGCLNCRHRFLWSDENISVCPKCGCELENCCDETYGYNKYTKKLEAI